MPAISVLVDSEVLATVNTNGLQLLNVQVQGARTDEAFASLDFHGMTAADGHDSAYLSWIDMLALQPGQEVEFRFLESGETTSSGKTVKELAVDDEADEADSEDGTSDSEDIDFSDPDEMAATLNELRAKPALRAGYVLQLFQDGTLIWNSEPPIKITHSTAA